MPRKKPNPFEDLPGDLLRAVAADPVATVLSHAFEGTPALGVCGRRGCGLPFRHPVHTVGEPGNEVGVRVASTPPRSPAVTLPNALRDVLRMLEQALAYSGATEKDRCKREELLRTSFAAVGVLCSELDRLDAYAKRMHDQMLALNGRGGRKQRKR